MLADAAQILIEAVQARSGHTGRRAVESAGHHLAESGVEVGQHKVALAVLLIAATGEDERPEMTGAIAAMLGGGCNRTLECLGSPSLAGRR